MYFLSMENGLVLSRPKGSLRNGWQQHKPACKKFHVQYGNPVRNHTVIAHGNEAGTMIMANGKMLTAQETADYLLSMGCQKGTPVQLAVCNAGKFSDGFAAQLSKILEAEVTTGTADVTIGSAGKVAPTDAACKIVKF